MPTNKERASEIVDAELDESSEPAPSIAYLKHPDAIQSLKDTITAALDEAEARGRARQAVVELNEDDTDDFEGCFDLLGKFGKKRSV